MDEIAALATAGRLPAGAQVARVVELEGLGSRRAGEAILLDGATGERLAGRLLGGAVDGRLAEESPAGRGAIRVIDVPIGEQPAVAAGLACGGTARILIQPADAIPAAWWEAVSARRPAALVTPLAGHGGSRHVPWPGEGDRAGRLLADRAPATVVEEDTVIEVWWPTPRVLVIGAAALAGALARQAVMLGWDAVLDDGDADAVAAAATAGPADAVVVLTHDPEVATPALAAALVGDAGYVGALGSRKTQADRRQRLQAAGVTDDRIARLHGPVGLDLGARTPEEQALAICAEIVAARGGRSGASLRTATGPING